MSKKTPEYTEEQQAALDWLKEMARLIRFAEAAIYMGRHDPQAWEDAQHLMGKLRATAAGDKDTPPG